jgi:hypothetical protein
VVADGEEDENDQEDPKAASGGELELELELC